MSRTTRPLSVKARVALFTLAIFFVSMVCLALYVGTVWRADLQTLLAAQQNAAANRLAADIDAQLQQRFQALEQVARLSGERLRQGDDQAQRMLAELPVFQGLFNGGTFLTDESGTAVASLPWGRVGLNYADRDYFQRVLATGRGVIGEPALGRALGVPVIVMAVPIQAGGRTVGMLAGVTDLQGPSFLDRVQDPAHAQIGDHLLVSTAHRMIIASSDKTRVMETLPAAGVMPAIDRYIEGAEGTSIFTNPQGVPVLASIKHLSNAPWYLAVALPTAQAFAPVDALQQRMLAAIGLLTIAAGALSWWMIRRQLTPLQTAARQLAALGPQSLRGTMPQALPVTRSDEIGQLILSFNGLLAELAQQRQALEKSELLYSTAFQTSPDAFSITRLDDGRYLKINDSFTRIFGWTAQDVLGRTSAELGIWHGMGQRTALMEAVGKRGRCENLELQFVARDGRAVAAEVSATVIEFEDARCLLAVTHDISGRKAAQAQIEQLALTDLLTALPNRRLLLDRLGQAVGDCWRRQRHGVLCVIDLDDFKSVNDRLGHDKGDLLLRWAGQQLATLAGPGDTVARLGGDEFVVLLGDLPADPGQARGQALALGDRILQVLGATARIDGAEHRGSASVGLALFGPDTVQAAQPLRQADLAMYHAKSHGRGQLCLFSAELQESLSSRVDLESAMRAGLARDEFELHYQVQVGPDDRIFGVEALLRWRHPTRGLVSPGEFIPVAEESGLIVALGRWVLQEACRQLRAWADDDALAGLSVGVNVSSRQFRQPDFVSQVRQALEHSGAQPGRLKLELTESLLIENMEDVADKIRQLRAQGVRFSLDDFGTGFSSLAYLKALPLDELKIDQGFVRDLEDKPNDLAIARTIVALGNSLGLSVTAEGVETQAQRQALAGVGCGRCQGYLFGRPGPAAAVAERVRAQARAQAPAGGYTKPPKHSRLLP